MDKDDKYPESRWSKFVSSFEDYSYSSFGDIDESYLTPHERTIMFKDAVNELKYKIKSIRERKKKDKNEDK
jgi:hypothetical protein